MERFYEIKPVEGGGWILKLYEDGEDAGGSKGGEDDYADSLQEGEEFVGVSQSSVRP